MTLMPSPANGSIIWCAAVTPSQRGKTHYFWGAAFYVPNISEDVAAKTKQNVVAAFDEDEDLLQKIQV